jgi:hypothetical protein
MNARGEYIQGPRDEALGRYLGEERNDAGAAPDTTRSIFASFEGPGRFGPMAAWAPPCVGRLHGVLAHFPSAQIAAVAHARLDQSFPSVTSRRSRSRSRSRSCSCSCSCSRSLFRVSAGCPRMREISAASVAGSTSRVSKGCRRRGRERIGTGTESGFALSVRLVAGFAPPSARETPSLPWLARA